MKIIGSLSAAIGGLYGVWVVKQRISRPPSGETTVAGNGTQSGCVVNTEEVLKTTVLSADDATLFRQSAMATTTGDAIAASRDLLTKLLVSAFMCN